MGDEGRGEACLQVHMAIDRHHYRNSQRATAGTVLEQQNCIKIAVHLMKEHSEDC